MFQQRHRYQAAATLQNITAEGDEYATYRHHGSGCLINPQFCSRGCRLRTLPLHRQRHFQHPLWDRLKTRTGGPLYLYLCKNSNTAKWPYEVAVHRFTGDSRAMSSTTGWHQLVAYENTAFMAKRLQYRARSSWQAPVALT